MATETPKTGPNNVMGWLILLAIFAAAGAVVGSPGRGPVSEADADWTKWAGIVAQWAVTGALIGYLTARVRGQRATAAAVIAYAVMMPVLMLAIEGLRVAAAWYTGGWEAGVTSAAVGAGLGLVAGPLLMGLATLAVKVRSAAPPGGGSP